MENVKVFAHVTDGVDSRVPQQQPCGTATPCCRAASDTTVEVRRGGCGSATSNAHCKFRFDGVIAPTASSELYPIVGKALASAVVEGFSASLVAAGPCAEGRGQAVRQLAADCMQHIFDSIDLQSTTCTLQCIRILPDDTILDVFGVRRQKGDTPKVEVDVRTAQSGISLEGARSCIVETADEAVCKLEACRALHHRGDDAHACALLTLSSSEACGGGGGGGAEDHPRSLLITDVCGAAAQRASLRSLFNALAKASDERNTHIPREGVLMQVLRDSYGGVSRCTTLLALCAAGGAEEAAAALEACQLGARAMKVRNMPLSKSQSLRSRCTALELQNEELRGLLSAAQSPVPARFRRSGTCVSRSASDIRQESSGGTPRSYTKLISEQFELRSKNARLAARVEEMQMQLEAERAKRRTSTAPDHAALAELAGARQRVAELEASVQAKDAALSKEQAQRQELESARDAALAQCTSLEDRMASASAAARSRETYVTELERTLERVEATMERQVAEERTASREHCQMLGVRITELEGLLKECGDTLERCHSDHDAEVERLHSDMAALVADNQAEVDGVRAELAGARDAAERAAEMEAEAQRDADMRAANERCLWAAERDALAAVGDRLAAEAAEQQRGCAQHTQAWEAQETELRSSLASATGRVAELEATIAHPRHARARDVIDRLNAAVETLTAEKRALKFQVRDETARADLLQAKRDEAEVRLSMSLTASLQAM